MESSCEIIVYLCLITLGGVTVSGTLGGGTVIATLVGAIFGDSLGTTFGLSFLRLHGVKYFFNLLMTCNWLSPIVKGVCGPVFLIMCISSLEAIVACSVTENPGMKRCRGKNFTTSACIPPLVLGV